MKKKISKEVKIGISFIICIFILYFGISFLKGVNIFKPTNSYMVVFDDVTGLTLSSPVMLNGYQIGLVYSMEIDKNDPRRILAVINLNKGVKISKGSEVDLDVSMLGNATVIVKPNYAETNDFYTTEDTIRGKREHGMLESVSKDLMPQISVLLPRIDSILVGLNNTVNHPSLNQSLTNVEAITSQLETSTKQLNVLLTAVNRDVPTITSNIAGISNDLSEVTTQVKSMDFAATYNSVDSTLKNIQTLTEKMNSKDNSIGLLLNDTQLHDSIVFTLSNASLLLKDIKENPSKYINVKIF